MVENSTCGSAQCLVDRLEATVKEQHEDSKIFLEKIISLHVQTLSNQVGELRNEIKQQGDIVHPQLREITKRLTIVETKIGEGGIEEKVQSNETVKWAAGRRSFEKKVAVIVLAATIIGAATTGIVMYAKTLPQPSVKAGGK